MTDLFFEHALLPTGWARRVRLAVAPDGGIAAVETEVDRAGAECFDGVAVAGVPNLHSHAFQRAMAGLTERGAPGDDSFWSWRARMYEFLERLGPDEVEAIAAQLQVELLRHGYTALTEFHYLRNAPDGSRYADPAEMARRIARAATRTGIGLTLLPVLYQSSDFGGAHPTEGQRRFVSTVDEWLEDITALGRLVEDDPNQRVGLALHSLRAVSPKAMEAALAGGRSLLADAPVHLHIAEQTREVDACVAWSGARPVEWLLANAEVDASWCLIHATHMTDAETAALAASGAVVGLCPTTEANLGDGIFPLRRFMEESGVWGVGTDSHVSVSPVADLRLLEYGQRLVTRERNAVAEHQDRSTARVLLERGWAGGAQASGRPLGRLAAGARADVVVLDTDHPALAGRSGDEVLDSWIFSGEDTPVRDVIVGGQRVIRDGRHPRQDEILAAYRTAVRAPTPSES
jgi:formimidoylglutamate deiminase